MRLRNAIGAFCLALCLLAGAVAFYLLDFEAAGPAPKPERRPEAIH